jgi:hypothetical protein
MPVANIRLNPINISVFLQESETVFKTLGSNLVVTGKVNFYL